MQVVIHSPWIDLDCFSQFASSRYNLNLQILRCRTANSDHRNSETTYLLGEIGFDSFPIPMILREIEENNPKYVCL